MRRNMVGVKIGTDSTKCSSNQLGDWPIHGPFFYRNDSAYILLGLLSGLIKLADSESANLCNYGSDLLPSVMHLATKDRRFGECLRSG